MRCTIVVSMLDEAEKKEYTDFNSKTVQSKTTSLQDISELLHLNIGQIRSFSVALLNVNITVIAGLFAAYLAIGQGIAVGPFVILSLALFLLDVTLIIFYCTSVLTSENERLDERVTFLRNTHDEVLALVRTYYHEDKPFEEFDSAYFRKLKEFADQDREQAAKHREQAWSVKWLYFFSAIFLAALVSAVAGLSGLLVFE